MRVCWMGVGGTDGSILWVLNVDLGITVSDVISLFDIWRTF